MTGAQHTSTTSGEAAVDRAIADIRSRLRPWLRTREGVASVSLAAALFAVLWGPIGDPVAADVLLAAFAIVLVSLASQLWESLTTPPSPTFSPLDGTVELEHDENAGFWRDTRGFLWASRVWFVGTGCPPCQLSPETYLRLRAWRDEGDLPVFVARTRERQWWWWRNAFYWESGDYEPEDVRTLLVMLERDDQQGLEWELDRLLADPIPEDVKRRVFERDGGRCLACGSRELIQFNHVIPSSLGGENEPENIRLLCGACNRRVALAAVSQPAIQGPVRL
jgi:hypothetical protein